MQDQYTETEPIFRLKPLYRSNVCEVKLVGYMDSSQKLADETLEFETTNEVQGVYGKNVDYISKVKNYSVTASLYKNNVVGNYLLKTKFIPIYSVSIAYSKTLVSGFLFDLFIGFELDEESQKMLSDPRKCLNSRLHGKFILKLYCDDEVISNYDKVLNLVEEKIVTEPDVIEKMNSLNEDDFMNFLDCEIEKRKKFLLELKEGIELKELQGLNKTIIYLRELYKLNDIEPIIKIALEIREDERRKKYSAIEKYDLPTKVLNIKDVENDPEYLNKYLNITE